MPLFNHLPLLFLLAGSEALTQRHDANSTLTPQECVRLSKIADGCPRLSFSPRQYVKQMLSIVMRSAAPFVPTLPPSSTVQGVMTTTTDSLPIIHGSSMTTLPLAMSNPNLPRIFPRYLKLRHHTTANLLLPPEGIWHGRRRRILMMASSLT
jgi:hypothetical protein